MKNIEDFIKVEQTANGVNILVCQIIWIDSHVPQSEWKIAAELPRKASATEIELKIAELKNDSQYFRVCKECGERNPCGWMHDNLICQRCAELKHDVIY